MPWSLRQCCSFRWWILALCLCPLFVTSALAQQSDSLTIIAAPREQLPVEMDALTRVERVNKYTGVRFKADELAAEIRSTLTGVVEA